MEEAEEGMEKASKKRRGLLVQILHSPKGEGEREARTRLRRLAGGEIRERRWTELPIKS